MTLIQVRDQLYLEMFYDPLFSGHFHDAVTILKTTHQGWSARRGLEIALDPLKAELNPICHLLVLLGAHHILYISGIRVKKASYATATN